MQGGWALALALKTEVFYDAAGSLTFLALALGSLGYGASFFPRQVLLTVMACVWTLRLGGFLLMRVLVTGGDSRFDEAKHQPREYCAGPPVCVTSPSTLPPRLSNSRPPPCPAAFPRQ